MPDVSEFVVKNNKTQPKTIWCDHLQSNDSEEIGNCVIHVLNSVKSVQKRIKIYENYEFALMPIKGNNFQKFNNFYF